MVLHNLEVISVITLQLVAAITKTRTTATYIAVIGSIHMDDKALVLNYGLNFTLQSGLTI